MIGCSFSRTSIFTLNFCDGVLGIRISVTSPASAPATRTGAPGSSSPSRASSVYTVKRRSNSIRRSPIMKSATANDSRPMTTNAPAPTALDEIIRASPSPLPPNPRLQIA